MKKLFQYLGGYVVVEICGADCRLALNKLMRENIAFWNVRWMDALTIRVHLFPKQKDIAIQYIAAALCDFCVVEEIGFMQKMKGLRHRYVLVVVMFLCLFSSITLPRYVFFYEVVGNETIPKESILRELQNHGIGFGTKGTDIHPAWVKNHMINAFPKLKWLTITQNGCCAKVIVRERPDIPETENRRGFSDVVASRSGIITQMSVYAGQPLVLTGETVEKGQLLVSGIVDLERIYMVENANAEIFARTWREISACMPEKYEKKGEYLHHKTELSVQFGQKRIKLFGNSGISHGSCDKMITRLDLTLPGNFKIPVSLEFVQISSYASSEKTMSLVETENLLTAYVEGCVNKQLQAGEILASTYRMEQADGKNYLHGVIECHEMIAERVSGKIVFED